MSDMVSSASAQPVNNPMQQQRPDGQVNDPPATDPPVVRDQPPAPAITPGAADEALTSEARARIVTDSRTGEALGPEQADDTPVTVVEPQNRLSQSNVGIARNRTTGEIVEIEHQALLDSEVFRRGAERIEPFADVQISSDQRFGTALLRVQNPEDYTITQGNQPVDYIPIDPSGQKAIGMAYAQLNPNQTVTIVRDGTGETVQVSLDEKGVVQYRSVNAAAGTVAVAPSVSELAPFLYEDVSSTLASAPPPLMGPDGRMTITDQTTRTELMQALFPNGVGAASVRMDRGGPCSIAAVVDAVTHEAPGLLADRIRLSDDNQIIVTLNQLTVPEQGVVGHTDELQEIVISPNEWLEPEYRWGKSDPGVEILALAVAKQFAALPEEQKKLLHEALPGATAADILNNTGMEASAYKHSFGLTDHSTVYTTHPTHPLEPEQRAEYEALLNQIATGEVQFATVGTSPRKSTEAREYLTSLHSLRIREYNPETGQVTLYDPLATKAEPITIDKGDLFAQINNISAVPSGSYSMRKSPPGVGIYTNRDGMIVVVDANNRNHPSQVLFNGEVAEPFGEEDGQVYYLTPHGTRIQFDQNLLYPNGGAQSSEDNGVSEISLLPPGVEMALKRLPGFSLDSGLNQPTSTADVNGLGSVPLGKGDNALTQPMTGGVCPNTQAAAGAQCAYVPGVPLGAGGERSYAVGGGFQPPAGADRDSGVMASSGLTAAQMQQVGEDLEKGTWLALGAATIYAILNAPMSLAQSYASFSLGTNRMFGQQDEYIQ